MIHWPWRTATPATGQLKKLTLDHTPSVTYAVGDIHGHYDLYRQLEHQIVVDARTFDGPALLIVLGDMIDRGPKSAQLLDHLLTPMPDGITRICLRGNHEDMCLRALSTPQSADDWIACGGAETLTSYGFHPDQGKQHAIHTPHWHPAMVAQIPLSHRQFLADLPVCVVLPKWVFSHAGLNPTRNIDQQRKDDLIWTDPTVLQGHTFAQCLIHGHLPVDVPSVGHKTINIDTGAYKSGILTAVRLVEGRAPYFITADAHVSQASANF
ncbi:metallophosphoesterase [Celeribacter marinus]|uniref:metallophosphoesterase n=1 Tax=Celeribacter marinus TaxID=1397108 RepID=UPI00317451C6